MQTKLLLPVLLACAFPLSGCLNTIEEKEEKGGSSEVCNIWDAKDLQVWINGMPGGSGPTLIVSFSADLPTPGYAFKGRIAEVLEMAPPQYVIDLIVQPPSGVVAQVVTRTEVRLDIPVQSSEASAVDIKCGGETLFYVDEVPTAY